MQTHYLIEARHDDWTILLTDLLKNYHPKDGNDVTAEVTDGSTIWHISRQLVPASAIAKLLGTTEEAVEQTDRITLEQIKSTRDWQKPTVSGGPGSGYGHA